MSLHFEIIEGHDAYTSTMAFALFNLDQNYFPTPWNEDSWKHLFNEPERSLILVYEEKELIGFSLFNLSRADSFAHLLKILVNPIFRKQKVGDQLLDHALSNLKGQGFHYYFLEVEEDNVAAQSLYQSKGFATIHRKKDFYGQGRAALIMTAEF